MDEKESKRLYRLLHATVNHLLPLSPRLVRTGLDVAMPLDAIPENEQKCINSKRETGGVY